MGDKPNIVFITSHDTGRHFGCYGVETLHTPHIDALAADGVLLENFFCTTPVCSPSRGAMMSGLYPQTNGMMGLVHPPFNWTYNDDVQHLSELLRRRGYRTALFFHQHEVMPDMVEKRLSFDDYLVHQETDPMPEQVGRAFGRYLDDYEGDQPFYAQIGFGLTHRKWTDYDTPPDSEKGVTVPAHLVDNEAAREDLAHLQGAVRHLDKAVGVILDALAASRFADNTIVVFTVDHGLEVPRAKWHLYDPGIEVAFIVRCPALGLTGGRRCGQLLSNVDVTPTLLELIGDDVPEYMEGRSFAPALRGDDDIAGRDAVYAMFVGGTIPEARCVRTGRYKLIKNFSNHRLLEVPVDIANPAKAMNRTDSAADRAFCPATQLYDLQVDPLEFENLAEREDYADIRRELERKLWSWLEEVNDPILSGPMRVPIYDEAIGGYERYKAGK